MRSPCAILEASAITGPGPKDVFTIEGDKNYESQFGFSDDQLFADELPPDSSLDITCAMQWLDKRPLKDAQIGIVVWFQPTPLSWPNQKRVFELSPREINRRARFTGFRLDLNG